MVKNERWVDCNIHYYLFSLISSQITIYSWAECNCITGLGTCESTSLVIKWVTISQWTLTFKVLCIARRFTSLGGPVSSRTTELG